MSDRYLRVSADISLTNIRNNVTNIKKLIKPETKLMVVVKADAYGHGAVQVAHEINDIADAYAVAVVEEGLELRRAGINKPILILGFTAKEQAALAIENDIAMTVFQYEMAEYYDLIAGSLGKKAKLHIKLDTGMSRIGFLCNDKAVAEIEKIHSLKNVYMEGIFTHFAKADEKDKSFTYKQFNRYMEIVDKLKQKGIEIPVKHVCNSAGIIEFPEMHLDMVRAGIITYGLYPSNEVDAEKLNVLPAMELKSKVAYVKELEKGVGIGYNSTYVTGRTTKVATIPVGYGDGYARALSNKGRVIIHGKSAPIIGRVCMDQFMADVTDIPETRQGDEVTLIGRDGDEFISVEEIGSNSCSFNYEVICDIGKRVPRVYNRK